MKNNINVKPRCEHEFAGGECIHCGLVQDGYERSRELTPLFGSDDDET